MRSIRSLALVAGFFFVTLAIFVQGLLPIMIPESRAVHVTRAIRTDLGEIKWARYPSIDYTPEERLGRAVYIREGCWYCHSQYVRPVAGEDTRWGPVSEAGEYAFDLPHLLATRRVGPDLHRVGQKYSDHWHYAHLWDPRMVVRDSLMPSYKWLFHQIRVPVKRDGRKYEVVETPELGKLFNTRSDRVIELYPNEAGLTFSETRDGRPVLSLTGFHGDPFSFDSLLIVTPTEELVGLTRYLQKLGMNRGAWRDVWESQNPAVPTLAIGEGRKRSAVGKAVYDARCVGCHGREGNGNGPAAAFLSPRPRDFIAGVFKFKSAPSGSLPADADLFLTISRGIPGTAMPAWHELPAEERLAVIDYIKTFSPKWKEEKPEASITIPNPPPPTPGLLAKGKELYRQAKCWECHGKEGKGDGPSAAQLKDEWGYPIPPTNFTQGRFKAGSDVRAIYRTMSTGLDGTPMPSFSDSMNEDERWAISLYVLSLSAWSDPGTGRRLELTEPEKAALNDLAVRAKRPAEAYDAEASAGGNGNRQFFRGIRE